MGYLNQLREKLKNFQRLRKAVYSKECDVPLESHLLRVNTQVAFEFDSLLGEVRTLKRACSVESVLCTECLKEQEETLYKTLMISERVLVRLRKFKAEGFGLKKVNMPSNNQGKRMNEA